MYFKAALIACALLAGAPCAFAADTPATAGGDQGPVSTSGAKATDDNIARFLQDQGAAEPSSGPGLADAADAPPPPPDRAMHGEVGFSVGNHGYREGFGVATMQLSDHASATVAVDAGQIQYRGHTFNNRSVAVSLALGDAAGAPRRLGLQDVCSVHLEDRATLEPYWVVRMRQDQLAQQGRPCP